MASRSPDRRPRSWAALAVLFVHLLLGYALITGLSLDIVRRASSGELDVFQVREITPPPPESAVSPDPEPEGGAAPPNRRSEASPIVAPEPVVDLRRPPPVNAAPDRFNGTQSSQGAAETPGPGTGAGGEGAGTGSGRGGDGTGGGAAVSARRIAGEIRPRDYPRSASDARIEGTVAVNIYIGSNGRVTRCRVMRSSGNADLDATTCRLIEERFRYEPALNAAGEPVPDATGWIQRWWLVR